MAFQGFDSISDPSGTGRPQDQSPFAPINTPKSSPTAQRQSQRPFEAPKRSRSPPLDFVGKNSVQYSPEITWRPSISPHWGIQSKSPVSGSGALVQKRPLPVTPYVDLDNLGTISPSKSAYFHAQKRIKSPPSPSPANVYPGNLHNTQVDPERPAASPQWGNRPKSPVNDANAFDPRRPSPVTPRVNLDGSGIRSSVSPQRGIRPKSPVNDDSALDQRRLSRVTPHVDLDRSGIRPAASSQWGIQPKSPANDANAVDQRRPLTVAPHVDLDGSGIRSAVFPQWVIRPKSPVNDANALDQRRSSPGSPHVDIDGSGIKFPTKPPNFEVSRRTRSPHLPSGDKVSLGNLNYAESSKDPPKMHSPLPVENNHFADGLKETLAKAKRLARFGAELNQPLQSVHNLTKSKFSGNKSDQDIVEKQKFVVRKHLQEVGDIQDSNTLLDYEGLESTTAVVGLCLDMCPESEREERERKGDLDKYERLDGDRNQTSRFLAIKKYNRTAEREAELIRPMPVLQKTISYLLRLLDHPYDGKFLGMYNFLWDRMRAIRMDLRMQHIFNQDAITMLEQMIRLHIIAMHELCEYTKGEGFSEGFDAHLNIEQMNKAAVELFQLYDDHRKKGSSVLTEKEFRGYYALLKLDKHLGYKVETSELSLDLAKMTPEIRSAPEVLFARDVARACRTGNFIAFFRLARKATYLQACLMHAHFAKLRTQALASLHSGLQNNQGIPVVQVVKWLGMEGENIESLLEYHGFQIKQFEDAYMVKDGPFLNSNVDYQTKCSQLVHLKKSRRIIVDVSLGQELPLPCEEKEIVSAEVDSFDEKSESFGGTETCPDVGDEDMPDYEDDSASRDLHQHLKVPSSSGQEDENETQMDGFILSQPMDDSFGHYILQSEVDRSPVDAVTSSSSEQIQGSLSKGILPQSPKGRFAQVEASGGLHSLHKVDNSVPQEEVVRQLQNEAVASQNEEVAAAKLKLIIRRWKRWSLKRRELREYSQRVASAALSFLSVGMQISPKIAQRSHAGELNIDIMMEERYKRRERSWMRVNVSEVVGPVLREKNPGSKCICWKLIICSQMNDVARNESMQKTQTVNLAGEWLLSKLMNTGDKDDSDLVVSSLGMSLWRKWIDNPQICCLSIIRDVVFNDNRPVAADEVVSGVSAILFLASESIPWEFQRIRLHNLITSLPSGCSSPLLILFHGPFEKGVLDPSLAVINRLGLHDIDKTRIHGFSVIFLTENWSQESLNGFFSDDNLREGLKWLANQSSTQPILYAVKPRELVLSYLGSSLEALDHKEICEVGPNDCILAFNDALDRSIEEIVAAAASLPSWPSPEIDLLDESSSERIAVSLFLPDKDWRSAARVQSMVSAVKSCSLPWFNADVSWLNKGSDMGKEIHNHKWMLEKCLASYLTQSNIMMSEDLAAREASVVLQTAAHVELDGSNYRIVPQWVLIFHRIFNWRLMNLNFGKLSMAYVSEHPKSPTANTCNMTSLNNNMRSTEANMLFLKSQDKSHHLRTGLTLDDMIEVSCRHLFDRPEPVAEYIQTTSSSTDHERSAVSVTGREYPGDGEDPRGYVETDTRSLSHEQKNGSNRSKEPDRLSCLLEKCNIMQDKLAEQLAIFF